MATWRWFGRAAAMVLAVVMLAPLAFAQVQPRQGGELVFVTTEEPDTLDPQKTSAAVTGNVMRWLADTLITKDMSGNYIGGLAKSWNRIARRPYLDVPVEREREVPRRHPIQRAGGEGVDRAGTRT